MKISVDQLKKMSNELIEYVKKSHGDYVDLPFNCYWNIIQKEKYRMEDEPKSFTIGELEHDWSELIKINDGEAEPISYALVWLSSILRSVGENVP